MNKSLKHLIQCLMICGIYPATLLAQASTPSNPIPIKVVVVAMFERGEDTGDTPGEYQFWVDEPSPMLRATPAVPPVWSTSQ